MILPLAKGNAYASGVALSHSSDIKTWDESFGLGYTNNAIPANETSASGVGYNTVSSVNDLSDLFQANSVPEPGSIALSSLAGLILLARRSRNR